MMRRISFWALASTLSVPALASAFFFRSHHYCPPQPVYCPTPSVVVCPTPVITGEIVTTPLPTIVGSPILMNDCPPPMSAPVVVPSTPAAANPPRAMEKPEPKKEKAQEKFIEAAGATKEKEEAPKPKAVESIPAVGKPKEPEPLKVTPPSPPAPEPVKIPAPTPMPEKKPEAPPLPKFDIPLAKPEPATPKPEPVTPPKLDLPPVKKKPEISEPEANIPKLSLPPAPMKTPDVKFATPEVAIPKLEVIPLGEKKPEALTIPDIKLPPLTSESKYTPISQPSVRMVPVEGRRAAGKQVVNLYNYSSAEFTIRLGEKSTTLPAKSTLSVELPESFTWQLGTKSETVTIPSDAAGLCVVLE